MTEIKIMNKVIYFLILNLTLSACVVGRKTQLIKFDKEKWKSSSDYRYEITKTKDFPDFGDKSEKEVMRFLGKPDFINNGRFVYCLDIPSKGDIKCKGCILIIGFEKGSPYNVTIVHSE